MKKYKLFIGVDVSKLKLDVCIMDMEHDCKHQIFDNSKMGIGVMTRWISNHVDLPHALFCIEHTGVYGYPLCSYLSESGLTYALVAAIQIKKSLGIQRGKSDKADAKAIARYAMLHKNEITPSTFPEKLILKLKILLSHRERMVNTKKGYTVISKELSTFVDSQLTKDVIIESKVIIKSMAAKIKKADQRILELLESEQKVREVYKLITSVPGIGLQIAAHLIVCTRCFTCFKSSRQLACYAGVAPFEYSSGSSIKGRTRVSPFANQKIKSLLTMGAISVMRLDPEMNSYYARKLKEGKNPMSVINAIRNKLISRVFATVKRGTPYVKTMNYAA